MSIELVAIGDLNWDTVLTLPRLPGPDGEVELEMIREAPGGDAANVAVAFARLGGSAGMVGAVGDDPAGKALREHLTVTGVDAQRVLVINGPSGRAFSLVEPGGTRRLLYIRGANARRRFTSEDLRYLRDAEWLFIADPLPSTLEALAMWYRGGGSLPSLALDPGSAGAAKGKNFFAPILPYLSAIFLNEGEALTLSGRVTLERAVELLQETCPLVVVKRGEAGALVATRDEEFAVPAFPVRAVDTTGCGDAFNAAFLLCLVRGRPLQEAARWGNAVGAMVAQRFGAYAPAREEVEAFLRSMRR